MFSYFYDTEDELWKAVNPQGIVFYETQSLDDVKDFCSINNWKEDTDADSN